MKLELPNLPRMFFPQFLKFAHLKVIVRTSIRMKNSNTTTSLKKSVGKLYQSSNRFVCLKMWFYKTYFHGCFVPTLFTSLINLGTAASREYCSSTSFLPFAPIDSRSTLFFISISSFSYHSSSEFAK